MKNKLLIYSISILSLFALTGCSNNNSSITTLQNQVDRVANIISNDTDISSVSPDMSSYSNTYSIINNHRTNSYNNLVREKQLKEDVLSLNTSLKSCLQNGLKLSKTKTNAIKTLTNNISTNLSKYNETKNKIKSNVKNITKNLKLSNINIVGAESEYISLNGNMNERYVYLCNIYDNLEQAYILIYDTQNNFQTDSKQPTNYNYKDTSKEEISTPNKNSRFKKNIDSYLPTENSDKTNRKLDNNSKAQENINNIKNIDSFNNAVPPTRNGFYNNYGYGAGYGYNGYNGYGYANGGYRRFNPNRNTDTFYPYNRNVDSYRPYPNYPVTANPINNQEAKEEKINNKNGVININENQENLISDSIIESQLKDQDIKIDDKVEEIIKKTKDITEKTFD